jgi:nitrate reductase / nitrite oxidoreductase, alpha subunit
VAETILMLAPETNGETAVKSWGVLEKRTGLSLRHLSEAAGASGSASTT